MSDSTRLAFGHGVAVAIAVAISIVICNAEVQDVPPFWAHCS